MVRLFLNELSRRAFLKKTTAVGAAAFLGSRDRILPEFIPRSCAQVAGKNIRWIVPFSPGGGYDIYSRLLEPFYERRIGAEISVYNIPGAGGMVGARILERSAPDGLTLGILNASGLLVAAMTGETRSPHPGTDFTILGRIARDRAVWFTGPSSPFRTIEDVLLEARKRAIVFGITEVASVNFVNITVGASLLNIDVEFVAGFPGSRETSLAVVRGDVDVGAFHFESILDRIEAGDLRPILQVSANPISPHPSLEAVPLLGGDQGVAAGVAAQLGRDWGEVKAVAEALTALSGAGRLIAAPLGLDDALAQCLEQRLYETLTDPAFVAAATKTRRSLDVASASDARNDMQTSARRVESLLPIVRNTINKIRG